MDCIDIFNTEYERVGCRYKAYNNLSKECKSCIDKPKKKRRNAEFLAYKKECWAKTEAVANLIAGIEHRGFKKNHIDHIVSIYTGFKHGISPDIIASVENLRMITYKDNMDKGTRITTDSAKLLEKWFKQNIIRQIPM